jgi:gamma-glutamyltranspeptidase/glutathione hydrolase
MRQVGGHDLRILAKIERPTWIDCQQQTSRKFPMRLQWLFCAFLVGCLALEQLPSLASDDWQAAGQRGVIVAGGKGAVAAGMSVFSAGGNAMDAGVATILAQSVTDSSAFCFGGEVPILVYDANRKLVESVSGQGTAPRLATREYFASRGGIPGSGIEPAAIPATLDACLTVLDRYGTCTFSQVVAPTLQILDRHQADWHADLAKTLRRLIEAEQTSAGDRRRGLRLVADYFYRGPLARELASWCEANGGLIRYSDLATHVTRIEEPATVDYRGYTIYKCGPWTQGPYVLQALRLLEGFDLKASGHNQPQTIHLTIEAMKLALADRDVYYGDPLFVAVPLEQLLSKSYADLRRPLMDPHKASLVQRPGDPRRALAVLDETETRSGLGSAARDTTTCLAADAAGNVLAATPSGWSGVLAGKTGIWLGTRLQSFNLWPNHPNVIEPGKRPRITLTPTIVTKASRPSLAVSVAGGDGQDQATLQLLLNHIDFALAPAESVTVLRFGTNHHVGSFRQAKPDLGSLLIYKTAGEGLVSDLAGRGHKVQRVEPPLWAPSAIVIDREAKRIEGAGDPLAGRHAAGW